MTDEKPPESQGVATDEQIDSAAKQFWGDYDNDGIIDAVWQERLRQLTKWGYQTRPSGTGPKHVIDLHLARQDYDIAVKQKRLTWNEILAEEFYEALCEDEEVNADALRAELIQVMAVAASWIQDIDNRRDRA